MASSRTLSLAVAALLAWVASANLARAQVVSPGKLASAHAQLEGSKNCKQCHSRRGRVEPARCLNCHDALNDSIKASKGYHASRASSRCGQCHQDHRGRKFDIIRWPSGSAERFNHKTVRYTLAGKHAQAKCRDCHTPAYQVASKVKDFPMDRRKRTYLGLSQACKTCHDDQHEGRLDSRCQKCHDERSFKKPPRFDHDDTGFALAGKHKDVECDDCHKKPGRTPEVLFRGLDFDACSDCHKDSHRGAMANRRGKTLCDSCHKETSWQTLVYRKADHSPQRMPLTGGHADPKCTECHGQKADRRPSSTCVNCHSDVHSGRFGQNCSRCHDTDNWRARPPRERAVPPTRISASARLGLTKKELSKAAFHQKTRFPLDGLHVRVKCRECHPNSRRGFKKRFQNIKHENCSDCHKDSHEGQFTGTRCTQCHSTDGWPLTTYGVTEHDESQYPLDGAHRGVACASCHPTSRAAATRYRFADRDCGTCHNDVHEGQFGKPMDAQRPVRKCAECHKTNSFTGGQFDHDSARLKLRGKHTQTACSSCHRKAKGANKANGSGTGASGKAGFVIYRGISPECDACHRDRHEGQFRRPPTVRKCDECHTQKRFRVGNFDHDQRTSYPLTGKHRDTRCNQCHFTVRPKKSNDTVLYRLGAQECADCHKNRHASLVQRVRGPSKKRLLRFGQKRAEAARVSVDACERCHSTAAWGQVNTVASFDHSDVGYTLRGGHDTVGCDRCHTATRALSRQCSSCHSDRHNGRLGGDCASCHQSTSWRATDIRAQHNQTRLPLTGGHALTDCTSCHPRDRNAQYIAVPVACIGCHREDYDNPITHPNHPQAGFGVECQECHRPAAWSPAYYSHSTWPLRGAHRVTTCTSCHRRDPLPRACENCHQDDRAMAQNPDHTAFGFPDDCSLCHNESAWRPAPFPQHEQSFPIARGNHSGLECVECHTNPTDTTQFTCLEPCHTRADMDGEHGDVSEYMYESRACLMCHPDGSE